MKKKLSNSTLRIIKIPQQNSYGLNQYPTIDEVKKKFGPAKTIGTPEEVRLACDEQLESSGFYSLLQHSYAEGQFPQSSFLGYGTLQQIAQNGIVRACIETTTDDMTRNWIDLKREGEDDKEEVEKNKEFEGENDVVTMLNQEIQRLKLRQVFHDAVELVGYMGGAYIYIDTGETDSEALKQPLNVSEFSAELKKDTNLRFIVIDPINVFPGSYNSTSPLRDDYFKPRSYWVLSQEIHATRMIRLVANEMPVLLKPAYNFLGLSQAQIVWDYAIHFQECRLASQRLLKKFSLTVMKTDMMNILTQGAGTEELDRRISLLVKHRSNDGIEVIDKEAEDIIKIETPLSGVTDIVRQALEILAAVNRTPAVKLLGISPSGFNATGDSDIRNYYDHILSQQEKILRPAIQKVINILQIKLFGKIDTSITFDFAALSEEDKAILATTQKTKADMLVALLDRQVISQEECREFLVSDPNSGFANLEIAEIHEMQEEEIFESEENNSSTNIESLNVKEQE